MQEKVFASLANGVIVVYKRTQGKYGTLEINTICTCFLMHEPIPEKKLHFEKNKNWKNCRCAYFLVCLYLNTGACPLIGTCAQKRVFTVKTFCCCRFVPFMTIVINKISGSWLLIGQI